MLKKRRFRKRNITKVTFVLSPKVGGDSVHVMGEFNDWQPSHPMHRREDGSWRTTVDLVGALVEQMPARKPVPVVEIG